MQQYLVPSDMQSVLVRDVSYQRAIRLLAENWDMEDTHLFSDYIKTSDVVWARKLQQTGLVSGKRDLSNYEEVQKFIIAHNDWLTSAAKQELLSIFN